jgi:hypothetical protein
MGRGKKSVVFETVESGDTGGRKPYRFLLHAWKRASPPFSHQPEDRVL